MSHIQTNLIIALKNTIQFGKSGPSAAREVEPSIILSSKNVDLFTDDLIYFFALPIGKLLVFCCCCFCCVYVLLCCVVFVLCVCARQVCTCLHACVCVCLLWCIKTACNPEWMASCVSLSLRSTMHAGAQGLSDFICYTTFWKVTIKAKVRVLYGNGHTWLLCIYTDQSIFRYKVSANINCINFLPGDYNHISDDITGVVIHSSFV